MKVDEIPMKGLATVVLFGFVNEIMEVSSLVYPVAEQLEHVRAQVLQCYDKASRAVPEHHPRRVYELAEEKT